MNDQTYLALPDVSGFISWLATELDSQVHFNHQYVNRKTDEKWSCSSLYNAFENYRWNHPGNARLGFNRGFCSSSNGIALSALRQDLVNACGSDSRTLDAAVDVMRWGCNCPQCGLAEEE